MSIEVIHGDMRDLVARWSRDGLRVNAIITDPPYHLSAIQKRSVSASDRGFMNSKTDEGDISFRPETWKLCLDILESGGRLACFGGARTFWRMAAAIDTAGFEYEDTIAWVYAQGLVLRHSRLKPCWEPIMLFRKPGPVRDLGIDECRVPFKSNDSGRWGDGKRPSGFGNIGSRKGDPQPNGRKNDRGHWPSNLIHDGSDEVINCFPDAPGQQGDLVGHKKYRHTKAALGNMKPAFDHYARKDSGSASRFFNACSFSEEESRLLYCAKAPPRERVYHCTICGENLLHADHAAHAHNQKDFTHLRTHPTLKPLSLMRHLVKLLTPSESVVLDPFAGTGTTLLAAKLEGRDAIGIERDETYAAHCRLRTR
jgi:site-specific DNA-methyltransferase (adenine-specific)